jgi:pimeloyl-ACP methyl ester carboxylesterase
MGEITNTGTGQILRLRDGRALEVWEYGDPAGHPTFFFHGLIGSHFQVSYIDEAARLGGLRVIAPNRPGVGRSDPADRASALDLVADVEDVIDALGLAEFSLIGISGGTPYALATLFQLHDRVRTVTLLSGMGPTRLPGALAGMEPKRRAFLKLGSRFPLLARRVFQKAEDAHRADPRRLLDRLVSTWSEPDQRIFRRQEIYELFLRDLDEVFLRPGVAPDGLARELRLYGNYGFTLEQLPATRHITLWHGLDDVIVPPAMAWALAQNLPRCEVHLVPGGHFVAVDIADQVIARLRFCLDAPADNPS